jgi:hypothetical protein
MLVTGIIDLDTCRFADVLPARRAVAGVCAAIGLVMLPVHLASYRDRGVLRRFDVSRYPRWHCRRPGVTRRLWVRTDDRRRTLRQGQP